jgi:hypothetical protein
MVLTGPDRDEVFQWDSSEPELMKAMILAGVQIQMPIKPLEPMPQELDYGDSCPECGEALSVSRDFVVFCPLCGWEQ